MAPLGIHVTVKSDFPVGRALVAIGKREANFDLSPFMSTADLPDPGSFLRSLFDGSLLRPTGNTNVSYFDDAMVNAQLARADRLSSRARERAFGRIAADLERNQAPIAVFSQPYQAEFISKRLGCLTEQPAFGGLDLAALCPAKEGLRGKTPRGLFEEADRGRLKISEDSVRRGVTSQRHPPPCGNVTQSPKKC